MRKADCPVITDLTSAAKRSASTQETAKDAADV